MLSALVLPCFTCSSSEIGWNLYVRRRGIEVKKGESCESHKSPINQHLVEQETAHGADRWGGSRNKTFKTSERVERWLQVHHGLKLLSETFFWLRLGIWVGWWRRKAKTTRVARIDDELYRSERKFASSFNEMRVLGLIDFLVICLARWSFVGCVTFFLCLLEALLKVRKLIKKLER